MARIPYFLLMVFVVLVAMQAGEANIKCGGPEAQRALALCKTFTSGSGQHQEPSGECCIAYRVFVNLARTTAERKQLCSCVQQCARTSDVPINIANLDALQLKCGLPFKYSGDPNFDCNTVN